MKIPLIWGEFSDQAEAEYSRKLAKWKKDEARRRKKHPEDDPAPKPHRRMHPDDVDMFLSLLSALKIILSRSINKSEMPRARGHLQSFLRDFMKVCSVITSLYESVLTQ